ncbi:hypothetical protein [Actinospica robiniae]|uniref:hypothetical protein n=1 Tax=Actinospica robiniae TaxID=304901 RepID=UPI0004235F4D|nr:hypothetical protein [Actinospica robiniae]
MGSLDDVVQLRRRIPQLEQQVTALGAYLADPDEHLETAREANRGAVLSAFAPGTAAVDLVAERMVVGLRTAPIAAVAARVEPDDRSAKVSLA